MLIKYKALDNLKSYAVDKNRCICLKWSRVKNDLSVKWYSRFIGMNKSGVLRNSPKSCGRSKLLGTNAGVSRVNPESLHVCKVDKFNLTCQEHALHKTICLSEPPDKESTYKSTIGPITL